MSDQPGSPGNPEPSGGTTGELPVVPPVVPPDGRDNGRVHGGLNGRPGGRLLWQPGSVPEPGAVREEPRSTRSAPVRPTPLSARGRRSLRVPAFWVTALLMVLGAMRIGTMLHGSFRVYPVATTTAMVMFGLYAVPFVLLVSAFDFLEREPAMLLATAFGWGGFVAMAAAVPGNLATTDLLAKLISPRFAASWGPAVAAPLIEEPVKLLGVVAVVLIAGKQINSVLDGFVYGAFVGLGFQVVEDIIYGVNAVVLAGHGDGVGPVIVTFLLRGFLAGLWSHTLFSALAGAGLGYFVVRRGDRSLATRLSVAGLALSGSMIFHFVWNSPWLADGFGYGGAGLLAAVLIKGAPALVMIGLLLQAARLREADYYGRELARLANPDLATAAEIAVLGSPLRRAAARRYARDRVGWRAAAAVRRLQRAQARLAVELSRGSPARPASYADVAAARRQLVSHRHPEAVAAPGGDGSLRVWFIGCVAAIIVPIIVALAIRALGGD